VVALFVNAHVDPNIPRNDKVIDTSLLTPHPPSSPPPQIISIPLGVKTVQSYQHIRSLPLFANKTRLLVINNSGWRHRAPLNEMVIEAFNHTIKNEYSVKKIPGAPDWRQQVLSSKFVLCPPGFSFDSFRIWETLLLGSIPIVESNPTGLDRTFSSLPILIVSSYAVLTPEFLEEAYRCFVRHADKFNYQLLKASYWRELVRETMRSGTVERINQNHPFQNRYCNYL
jgi:hypothetical protein